MKKAASPLLGLGLALLAGCSVPSDTGSAQLAVFLPRTGAASISRVSVTSSAANLPSASVELAPTHGVQGGLLGNLPASAPHSFLAQAFDSSGTLLLQGSASSVSISASQSSLVAITLQELDAPPASLNEPPVIDSLVAASTSVLAGSSLSLKATAHGLHPDGALSYAWSSTSGSFAPASAASTSWTAPASTGTQTLTLTVTGSEGLSSSVSLNVTVLPSGGQGAAQLTVSFNSSPRVDALNATPAQLAVGQATSVSASASDLDGDSLSYSWSASCAGSWAQASSSSARFTPSVLPADACNNCALTVSVSDGRGGQTTGTLALCVSTTPAPHHFNPLILGSYSSHLPWELISPEQVLTYELAASDPEGSALSFSWTATTGSLGTPASTASHSRTTWRAPSCVSEGSVPTITATVTNAFNLTATNSFAVMGLPTCLLSAWASTGSMASSRYNHTATPLPNGTVLVSGGQNTSGSLAAAEVYNPASGTWSATGSLAAPRYLHAAAPLPNGTVLVSGGYNNASGYLAAAEAYNPATGTWSAAGSMLSPRYNHTATPLPNGKVLVVGGFNNGSGYLAKAEVYTPASNTWSATGSMASLRAYHTATRLPNGKVLVAGGRGSSTFLATAELYDPASGTWSATGSMASPRASHTATLLPNGKVLVSGGSNRSTFLETAELYDPASGTWSAAGNMASRRSNSAAMLLPNGKVLVAGGFNTQNGYLATAELYDPASGTWSTADSMASPRGYQTATPLPNGKTLIAGGYLGSTPLATAELYTP
ncbi:kelch repeat-containing protein [Archangium sp.]|uniref:Kelch repeat-containing protein n=1 Tax=Archangium sp. TaxID=1872627 RepID=UPI00389AC992